MMGLLILIFLLFLIIVLEAALLLMSRSILIPYLQCSMGKKSLALVACDDGTLRMEPVAARDIAETKRFGTLIFDKNYKYSLCGVPTFLFYTRGPCVSVSIDTYVAAEKLRQLGVVANPDDRDGMNLTIKDAITADRLQVYDSIKTIYWDTLTADQQQAARTEFSEFMKAQLAERRDHFTEVGARLFPSKCALDEEEPENPRVVITDSFTRDEIAEINRELISQYPVPDDVKDYVTLQLTEDQQKAIMERAKIEYKLTPVDLSALYQYVPGFAGHVIQSRISMYRAEAFGRGIFGGANMKNIGGFIALIVAIGVCAYLVTSGGASGLLETLGTAFTGAPVENVTNATADVVATLAPSPTPQPTMEIRV